MIRQVLILSANRLLVRHNYGRMNRRIVVYCEKIWVHRDDLAEYEAETKRTVRPMLVPFGLK